MLTREGHNTRSIFRSRIAAVWFAAALIPGIVVGAGNLDFLKDAPITRFKGADLQIFQSNLNDALQQNADGDTHRWENPATGSSGEIELIKSFTRDGKHCRQVRITNRAHGYAEAKTDSAFCQEADGQWKIPSKSKKASAPPDKPAGN